MSISLPLDPSACGQADDVFYCKHAGHSPEDGEPPIFDDNDGRIPLTAEHPLQEDLRQDWRSIYSDILAHNRDGSRPFPACSDDGHDHHDPNCPFCRDEGDDPGEDEEEGEDPDEDEDEDDDGGVDDPVGGCPGDDEDEEEEFETTCRVSVFFDGTGNNRWNADTTPGADDTSYSGGESNVSKLERGCASTHPSSAGSPPTSFYNYSAIYVEGIGTRRDQDDTTVGFATGTGVDGIYAKVEMGIAALFETIANFDGMDKPIIKFDIDAFGFSRGAAAARYFIWRMMGEGGPSARDLVNHAEWALVSRAGIANLRSLQNRLEGLYDMQCEVNLRFVGLFDTVSSHGVGIGDFDDDVGDLHLNDIYMADGIMHLASAEEHRRFFSLTTVGAGSQHYLPGVHSDIGGGYSESQPETILFLKILRPFNTDAVRDAFRRDYDWLIDRGWCWAEHVTSRQATRLPGQPLLFEHFVNDSNEIIVERPNIPNYYNRIPLQIMADRARSYGIPFTGEVDSGDFTIHAKSRTEHEELFWAETEINAAMGDGKTRSPDHFFNLQLDSGATTQPIWLQQLRRKYLHMSARYAPSFPAHAPRFKDGTFIDNMGAVDGYRSRLIVRG